MRTSLGVVDGHLGETGYRGRVVDRAVLMQNTTVAMRCVFAQTDVSRNVERGECLAQSLDRLDYWAVRVICQSAPLVLSKGMGQLMRRYCLV